MSNYGWPEESNDEVIAGLIKARNTLEAECHREHDKNVGLTDRLRALESERDQISLTLAVAKADRDKWFNRARDLEKALRWSLRRTLPKDNAEEALFQQYRELANYPAETVCKYHLYRMIDEPCTCSASDRAGKL